MLCFINTKSGPQIGKDLRRKFLRVLNPLQARTCKVCFYDNLYPSLLPEIKRILHTMEACQLQVGA